MGTTLNMTSPSSAEENHGVRPQKSDAAAVAPVPAALVEFTGQDFRHRDACTTRRSDGDQFAPATTSRAARR